MTLSTELWRRRLGRRDLRTSSSWQCVPAIGKLQGHAGARWSFEAPYGRAKPTVNEVGTIGFHRNLSYEMRAWNVLPELCVQGKPRNMFFEKITQLNLQQKERVL